MNDHVRQVCDAVLGPRSAVHEVSPEDGLAFEIGEHDDMPACGAVTLASRGLMHALLCGDCGTSLSQELLMCCWKEQLHEDMPTVLARGRRARTRGPQARVGRGLGPSGRLLPHTKMEALYVSQPGYFDPALAEIGDDVPVQVRWLIPIHAAEAKWISEHGPEAFEEILVERDPDLLDLQREPVIAG